MRRALLAWSAAIFCSLPAMANAFAHIVQPGETLASISERFYGKIQNETLLVVANGLDQQGGIPIVPGMRLEVPAVSYTRISERRAWKDLALEFLGGEHRAHVLAEANDSKAWLFPELDAEIIIPYNLRFVATGNETIVGLAYRFLGDRQLAWQLDQYNARGGRRLEKGDVVLLPLANVLLTEEGKLAAKRDIELGHKQTQGATLDAQRQVERQLPELLADLRAARYAEAVELGTRFLATGDLTQPQLARIHRHLLEAFAALGVLSRAAESCTQWFKFDKSAKLDPVMMSPKLVAACNAGGVALPGEPNATPKASATGMSESSKRSPKEKSEHKDGEDRAGAVKRSKDPADKDRGTMGERSPNTKADGKGSP